MPKEGKLVRPHKFSTPLSNREPRETQIPHLVACFLVTVNVMLLADFSGRNSEVYWLLARQNTRSANPGGGDPFPGTATPGAGCAAVGGRVFQIDALLIHFLRQGEAPSRLIIRAELSSAEYAIHLPSGDQLGLAPAASFIVCLVAMPMPTFPAAVYSFQASRRWCGGLDERARALFDAGERFASFAYEPAG